MQILRAFLPSGLLSHVGAFYVHRVLTLCFPLLLLPLIATRLTVNAMGIFFVLQAWGLTLSYIIDYGFSTRGARSMASTDNADGRSTEISRIITAQLLLCGIILPTWILCRSFIPILQDNAMGAVLAFIMGAATAITPNWYFLGTHRLSGFIITDILSRIVTLIGIFILPYADGDFNTPYVIISVGQFITCGIALCLMARREDLKIVRLGAGLSALRENWKLCLNVIGFALSVSLNTILLSLFAAPAIIAAYGVAEKIIRGCAALMIALTQALYPHFTQLQKNSGLGLKKLILWGIGSNGILTLGALLGIWIFAPMIMPYLAKDDPTLALNFTYWQIPALFLFGLQGTVQMHGLLARGNDAAALTSILWGAVAYLCIGIIAIAAQSVLGVIAAQTINFAVMSLLGFYHLSQKKNPAV